MIRSLVRLALGSGRASRGACPRRFAPGPEVLGGRESPAALVGCYGAASGGVLRQNDHAAAGRAEVAAAKIDLVDQTDGATGGAAHLTSRDGSLGHIGEEIPQTVG